MPPKTEPSGNVYTQMKEPLQKSGFSVQQAQLIQDITRIELNPQESEKLKKLLRAYNKHDFINLPKDSATRSFLGGLEKYIQENNGMLSINIQASSPSKSILIATKK